MYNGSVYCRQIPLGLGGVCSICIMGLCTVDRSLLVWAGCVHCVQWVCVLSTDPSWSGRGVFNMYNGSVYCRQIPLGLGGVCSICIMGLCTVDRSLSVWAGCVQYVQWVCVLSTDPSRSGRGVFNMYNGSVYCRQTPLGLGGVCSICTMGLCTVDRALSVWAGCVQYVQWVCVLSTDPLGLGGVCSICTMGLCTVDRSLSVWAGCVQCVQWVCVLSTDPSRSGRGVFNMYNGSVYCRQIPLGLGGVCSICTMGLCTLDRSLLVWAGCVQYVQWVCVLSTDPSWSGRGVFNMYNGSVYCRQIPLGLGGVCSICTMGLCTVDRSLSVWAGCVHCVQWVCVLSTDPSWSGRGVFNMYNGSVYCRQIPLGLGGVCSICTMGLCTVDRSLLVWAGCVQYV